MPAPSGEKQAEADAPFDVIVIGSEYRPRNRGIARRPVV